MKRKTVGGVRFFTCKMYGAQIGEPLESWKKKPQADKNICWACREARATGNIITGEDRGPHMWNVVRMEDGNYYLTDITIYDTNGTGNKIPLLACSQEDPANYTTGGLSIPTPIISTACSAPTPIAAGHRL